MAGLAFYNHRARGYTFHFGLLLVHVYLATLSLSSECRLTLAYALRTLDLHRLEYCLTRLL